MKVKFNRDVATKEAKPQEFKKDQVVDFFDLYRNDEDLKAAHGDKVDAIASDMAKRSAQHWINRGAAEEVTDETKSKAKAKSEPAKAESLVPGPAHKGHGGKTEAL